MFAHGPDGVFDIFRRTAEQQFLMQEVGFIVLDLAAAVQVFQLDTSGGEPFAVRMFRRQFLFDFAVVPDLSLLRVHEQHLSGFKTTLAFNFRRVEVEDAHLACHDQNTALGDGIAPGTQSVAILNAAGVAAVAEQKRGRPVPGLHQDGVILVESAQVLRDGVRSVEALRHQHGNGLREAESAHGQEFQDVVQAGRVAHVGLDDRREIAYVSKFSGIEHALAGLHPAAVAADGIDLAIVAEHPEGLCQTPLRERVRREAGMDDCHRAGEPLARQVRVILAELSAGEHALVHDIPVGQGADIAILPQPLDVLPDAVELAFEIRVLDELGAGHENLHRVRLSFRSILAQAGGVDRYFPDMAQNAAIVLDLRAHGFKDPFALDFVFGQEHQSSAVAPFLRYGNSLQENEFMRYLDQDAGAVARFPVSSFGPAVAHVLEHRQGVVHQLMGLVAPDVDDHTDSAGIMFRCRIV